MTPLADVLEQHLRKEHLHIFYIFFFAPFAFFAVKFPSA